MLSSGASVPSCHAGARAGSQAELSSTFPPGLGCPYLTGAAGSADGTRDRLPQGQRGSRHRELVRLRAQGTAPLKAACCCCCCC